MSEVPVNAHRVSRNSTTAPISVVIPAYNAERFLAEAIQSVHDQTLKVAEIIVVADDCTDRTPQIAAELGATVLEQKRRNMAAGLNLGVSACTQPWIAFLDADDVWDQDKIALQWKAIETWPDTAIVSCDFFTLMDQKVTSRSKRHLRERWKNVKRVTTGHCHYIEKVDGGFLTRFFLATPSVVLRRDIFSKIGLLDESLIFGQTVEYFARILGRYPLAYIEKPLVYLRVHEHNHSRNFAGGWTSYISIVNRMLKHPELYPQGAGEAHRAYLKEVFLASERAVTRAKVNSTKPQPSKPNQL